MFEQQLYKNKVADMLGVSMDTLRKYLNIKYYNELMMLGYRKNQKYLTKNQLKFLEEKIGIL